MSKIVYILGPMRGIPFFNFPAFDRASEALVKAGHTVVNPAALDRQAGFNPWALSPNYNWDKLPMGMDLDEIITRDLAALRKCNAFYTLSGWRNSVGARAEYAMLIWQGAEWLNEDGGTTAFAIPPGDTKTVEAFPEAARVAAAIALSQGGEADPKLGPGGAPTRETSLPTDPKARKTYPVASGFLDYFPDAIVSVAQVSWQGNQQHNPGQPLFWARSKSGDEADALMRHFLRRGTMDSDGVRHSAKLAWRALALLQKEIEAVCAHKA